VAPSSPTRWPDTPGRRAAATAGGLVLALGLAVFPLLNEWFPVSRGPSGVRVLAGGLELAFAACALGAGWLRWPAPRAAPVATALFLAWVAWSAAAALAAEHLAAALVRQVEWTCHGVFALAVWSALRARPALRRRSLRALVAGFGLYGAFVLARWLAAPDPQAVPWNHSLPGFVNLRHFGYYATAVVAVAHLPAIAARGAGRHAAALAVTSVPWAFLVWSGSRSGVLAVLAAAAPVLALVAAPVRRRLALHLPAGLALGWALSRFFRVGEGSVERLADTLRSDSWSLASSRRTDLWEWTLDALRAHPWLGVGPDGFLYLEHPPVSAVQPHSVLLQMPLEWGLPGAALAAALLARLAARFGRARRAAPPDAWDDSADVAAWGALSLLAVSLVDGSLYHAHALLLFAFLLAAAAAPLAARSVRVGPAPFATVAVPALAVLGLHAWVLEAQTGPAPPPDTWSVRAVRAFPSNLDRTSHWAVAWAARDPERALEWLHWGHDRARWGRSWSYWYREGQLLVSLAGASGDSSTWSARPAWRRPMRDGGSSPRPWRSSARARGRAHRPPEAAAPPAWPAAPAPGRRAPAA